MKLSSSQLKTFNASKQKRAGQYILGIKEDYSTDALQLGQMFEHRLINKDDNFLLKNDVFNKGKFFDDYENLKKNAGDIKIKGQQQLYVEGELLGSVFCGYIDNMTNEGIIQDIKTSHYLTKIESETKNMRSNMSYMEEYELQMWIYMKLSKSMNSQIIEIAKHRYKRQDTAYQIIDINMTDEFDKKMTKKRKPIVEEILYFYKKYKQYV